MRIKIKRVIKNIFSVRNEDIHKVITILGLKLKFKSKKLVYKQRFENIEKKLTNYRKTISKQKKLVTNLQNKIATQQKKINSYDKIFSQQQIKIDDLSKISDIYSLLKKEYSNIESKMESIYSWQQNFYKDIPDEFPVRLSDVEKQTICRYLKDSDNYLEFGSGGSTFLALENSNTNVFSVESDRKWLDYLLSYKIINNAYVTNRLKFYHINIGKIKLWGYPINDDLEENYPNYSSEVFKKIDCKKIDTILIDGRFRVACAIQTILNCPNLKFILIHDYVDREFYHILEEFLNIHEVQDTLVVFCKKTNIDMNALSALYEKYKCVKE